MSNNSTNSQPRAMGSNKNRRDCMPIGSPNTRKSSSQLLTSVTLYNLNSFPIPRLSLFLSFHPPHDTDLEAERLPFSPSFIHQARFHALFSPPFVQLYASIPFLKPSISRYGGGNDAFFNFDASGPNTCAFQRQTTKRRISLAERRPLALITG